MNFLEMAFAAGGSVLSDDGKKSTIDSPENLKALQLMVDGIKNGVGPEGRDDDDRGASPGAPGRPARRRSCATGPTRTRCRSMAPKVKGKFAVAPYPEFEGGGKAAVLGGHNMVISTYSKNPGAMLKFIDYATSTERIIKNAVKYSKTPTIAAAYDDPAVKKAMPFADALRAGVEQAKSRPVSPVYPQISEAIFKNINAALCRARPHRRTRSRRPTRTSTTPWRPSREQQMEAASVQAGTPTGRRSRGISERRLAAYMVSPSLILIALVAAYPIGYAIWLSLHEYSVRVAGLSRWAGTFGLRNYSTVLQDSEFWDAVKNTFIFTACSVTLETLLGHGDGAGDAQRLPGSGRSCAPSSWCRGPCSTVVTAMMWRTIFDPTLGFVERSCWAPTRCGSASRRRR